MKKTIIKEFRRLANLHEMKNGWYTLEDGVNVEAATSYLETALSRLEAATEARVVEEIREKVEAMRGRCDCEFGSNVSGDTFQDKAYCNGCGSPSSPRFVLEEGCLCGLARIDEILVLFTPKASTQHDS